MNGQLTFEHTVDKAPLSGFVGIGTSSYGIADFDNLNIFNTNKRKFILYEGETDINSETLYFVPRLWNILLIKTNWNIVLYFPYMWYSHILSNSKKTYLKESLATS